MDTPLNAAASTAGSLISGSVFEVPPYQREYSWQEDEIREFFEDIQRSLEDETYFLGLIILTEEDGKKKIVDGQQRIVTLTLLAAALYHEAKDKNRSALADRLSADFLYSINYETDGSDPRVNLTDSLDNDTLQKVILTGDVAAPKKDDDTVSAEIAKSYRYLRNALRNDLKSDPFKRLGKWTEFITHKLYFAVFVHPDPSSAYQVFEVINTRGRDLTTADLLKNFIISQSPPAQKDDIYNRWKKISDSFEADSANSFVQYIRHAVTIGSGHILPRDLFSFLASRTTHSSRTPPSSGALLDILEKWLPLYLQMADPSLPGPASDLALGVFQALNRLNVITVRPMMMAMTETPDQNEGLERLLKLVVRRIVVGNLGTGNIERRFAEAARKIGETHDWHAAFDELNDLNPERDDFVEQAKKRSLNKSVMSYLRNSISSGSLTPSEYYSLHYIIPKSIKTHPDFSDGELNYWGNTLGNTFLSVEEKRQGDATWGDFLNEMLPLAAPGEPAAELSNYKVWNVDSIKEMGMALANKAAAVWYD